MTNPTGFVSDLDYTEARKRWLNRYARVQGKADRQLKVALTQAAEDAYKQLILETSKSTFSARVKSAQIRILLEILKEVFNELYSKELRIIVEGNGAAAIAAVSAFAETDRSFLRLALNNSKISVADFIASQRHSAVLGVGNAVSRLTRSDQNLSQRVYHTRAISNGWVKQRVTAGIARGASAQEIAKDVRSFIRPTTQGGVSYAALRLGRTEINNAFHATSIELAKDRPWVEGMKWRLSATHDDRENDARIDKCDIYADQVFDNDNVPAKPHPQCRCFVTPEVESMDVFIRHLTSGQYRSWIDAAA